VPSSWMIVDVELVSGRGEFMEPRPGRQMLVGPKHTMEQFARAESKGRTYHLPSAVYRELGSRPATSGLAGSNRGSRSRGRRFESDRPDR
jgi:hypothetical protein